MQRSLFLFQDGYAVVASDGPGEYPVITDLRAGDDGFGVVVVPGTVAYVTTGGYFADYDDVLFETILVDNYNAVI